MMIAIYLEVEVYITTVEKNKCSHMSPGVAGSIMSYGVKQSTTVHLQMLTPKL